ncbi:MAG: hypothetical protein AAF733_11420 [Verrucomicrobiota bacterium]
MNFTSGRDCQSFDASHFNAIWVPHASSILVGYKPREEMLTPTEHAEGKEVVVIVIDLKKHSFLMAVDRVVSSIKVQHDLLRRRLEGLDEGRDHQLVEEYRNLPISMLHNPAELRRTGQGPTSAHGDLKESVLA